MAKKQNVVIENVELKPQTIGFLKKKKNNIGRVIIIFVAFILTILYLPDVTIFINNLLGIKTSDNIINNTKNEEKEKEKDGDTSNNEIVYHEFNDNLVIDSNDYSVSNFNLTNGLMTFNINNKLDTDIDFSKEKIYLETYNENKTLIERKKVDLEKINKNGKELVRVEISDSNISFIVFSTKTNNDYPIVELTENDQGIASMACSKDYITYNYKFRKLELNEVEERINYNYQATDQNYNNLFNEYQKKAIEYDLIDGINASFNSSANGFNAAISADMSRIDNDKINDKYYFSYQELAKVIKFEMETYGFNCK